MTEEGKIAVQENQMELMDAGKAEWDIAQSTPPRNLALIWKMIEDEMHFAPEYAGECWYSIPYKDKTGKLVPVEGIGIRGAEGMLRLWGHCSVGGGVREDMGDKVVCRGVFRDHKTGATFYREVVANRWQRSRDGKPYRLEGKHWDNLIQSCISKAQRNAGLQGIPPAIKERFFKLAKELSLQKDVDKPVKERIQNAKKAFVKDFKITAKDFDDHMAGLTLETDEEVYESLKGLYHALKSGEIAVGAIFGPGDETKIPAEKKRKSNNDGNA